MSTSEQIHSQASDYSGRSVHTPSQSDGLAPGLFEPIAILGIGNKLPGNVRSPEDLWELLINGRSGHSDIPKRAFDINGFHHPDGQRPGSLPFTGGYFIQEEVGLFENAFFGINNLEASFLDPQQRKLLEVVYECLENAGQSLDSVSGTKTGCYIGNFTVDWTVMQYKDADYASHTSATGCASSILANRLSYVFNLCGPSVVLDTACSSSIYALHLACTALNRNECDAAIVASANLIQSPEQTIQASKAGILSPDSTCHTFDSSANGYGRGEAVGSIYIKRVSDALRDGDPIRAVIRATAVNANGKTTGISLPSAARQAEVISSAYHAAGLSPVATQYVESHGTGTSVGDPIEVEGLVAALRPENVSAPKLLIGSVKTNLGHSEGASAISSIIKVVLSLERGIIPPTIGLGNLNPKLHQFLQDVEIVTKPTVWPSGATVRRAGVNSFGFGGANGHVILESAEHWSSQLDVASITTKTPFSPSIYILPISARTQTSLAGIRTNLVRFIETKKPTIKDLAWTLAYRRQVFNSRSYLIVGEDDAQGSAKRALQNTVQPQSAAAARSQRLTMVFTGQGAQSAQMGMNLFERFHKFHDSVTKLDHFLKSLPHAPQWTFQELLESANDNSWDINSAAIAQPLCTCLQIALVDLYRDWGLQPDFVVGHSSGEIAAAYCAGAIDARQAIATAYYRGLAVSDLTSKGAMAAVGETEEAVSKEIADLGLQEAIKVACINSPKSTTVSGDEAAIDQLVSQLRTKSIFVTKLKTDGRAYHSHHMRTVGERYQNLIAGILEQSPFLESSTYPTMISSMTGVAEDRSAFAEPRYWRQNLESPVLFRLAIEELLKTNPSCLFVEVGPHSVLQMPLKDILATAKLGQDRLDYVPSLVRKQPPVEALLSAAGELFARGWQISFDKINDCQGVKILKDLPPYPWEYDPVQWNESRASRELRQRQYRRHFLLGNRVAGSSAVTWTWQNILRQRDISWLSDHTLDGRIVFPAAGYITIGIEALRQRSGLSDSASQVRLRNFKISKALIFPDDETGVEIVADLRQATPSIIHETDVWYDLQIHTVILDKVTVHATGQIAMTIQQKMTNGLSSMPHHHHDQSTAKDAKSWYTRLDQSGFFFGPQFQNIRSVRNPSRASMNEPLMLSSDLNFDQDAWTSMIAVEEGSAFLFAIDAALQTAILSATGGSLRHLRARVPVSIKDMTIETIRGSASPVSVLAACTSERIGSTCHNLEIMRADGTCMARLEDVRLVEYQGQETTTRLKAEEPFLRICWKPDVSFMRPEHQDAVDKIVAKVKALEGCSSNTIVAFEVMVDAFIHKWPGSSILCLEPFGEHMDFVIPSLMKICKPTATMHRLNTIIIASRQDGELWGKPLSLLEPVSLTEVEVLQPKRIDNFQRFDLVISGPDMHHEAVVFSSDASKHQEREVYHISLSGSTHREDAVDESAKRSIYSAKDSNTDLEACKALSFCVYHSTKPQTSTSDLASQIYFVYDQALNTLETTLVESLMQQDGFIVTTVPIRQVTSSELQPGAKFVVSAELSRPILANVTADELQRVQCITNIADTIVWLTADAFHDCSQPKLSMAAGLARALMVEQPALKFFTLDLGLHETFGAYERATCQNLLALLGKSSSQSTSEYETVQRQGLLWCSRFLPDDRYNRLFGLQHQGLVAQSPIRELGPIQLVNGSLNGTGQVHFEQFIVPETMPGSDFIRITVRHATLGTQHNGSTRDVPRIHNQAHANTFVGTVHQVGPQACRFNIGDTILVHVPCSISSEIVVPEWACVKIHQNEPALEMISLPKSFYVALYITTEIARLAAEDSILVTSAANAIGQATIQIARLVGSKVIATVNNPEEQTFLIANYGLSEEAVLLIQDETTHALTNVSNYSQSVDHVVVTDARDFTPAVVRCCAPFGNLIRVSQEDTDPSVVSDLSMLAESAALVQLDVNQLFFSAKRSHQRLWAKLLSDTLRYYREGSIRPVSRIETFGIDMVNEALDATASDLTAVISFDDQNAVIPYRHPEFQTRFDATKRYILIGGLGGIGRSLSQWMLERGAKKFTFLNRSGLDRPASRELVANLRRGGAEVTVVRGSVDNYQNVKSMVDEVSEPIGGVIHTAMGLHEAIFAPMTSEQWQTAVTPKVQGALNLHRALVLREREIDFFMVMSSNTGSVGTATESNYCAANAFLDSFVRYRRLQGLKAVSVGLGMISEVGYIHEHPEIEKLLLRKGLHPIVESEMLQILDIAISSEMNDVEQSLDYHKGHVLTGLELTGLKAQREQGFEGHFHILDDPRFGVLAYNFERWTKELQVRRQEEVMARSTTEGASGNNSTGDSALPAVTPAIAAIVSAAASSSKKSGGAASAATMITSLADATQKRTAVHLIVAHKMANLVLVPADSLGESTMLRQFGMDSMLAAEFRSHVQRALGVDVPFITLLDPQTSIATLVEILLKGLTKT